METEQHEVDLSAVHALDEAGPPMMLERDEMLAMIESRRVGVEVTVDVPELGGQMRFREIVTKDCAWANKQGWVAEQQRFEPLTIMACIMARCAIEPRLGDKDVPTLMLLPFRVLQNVTEEVFRISNKKLSVADGISDTEDASEVASQAQRGFRV